MITTFGSYPAGAASASRVRTVRGGEVAELDRNPGQSRSPTPLPTREDVNGGAPTGGTGLRIIIDNGEYGLQNKGDLAMLDVTVGRLRERWPASRIGVVTFNPPLLRAYEPRAEPLAFSKDGWWGSTNLLRRLPGRVSPSIVAPVYRAWRETSEPPRRVARRVRDRLLEVRRLPTHSPAPASDFATSRQDHRKPRVPRAVESASLVLALGGGYMADIDPDQAHRTFDLLERAFDLGVPTAMVGQGLGPLENPALLERARRLLPRVDFIALRENRHGPALLDAVGVDPSKVVVTGDDAVELAHGLPAAEPRTGLGICLRLAPYTSVPADVTPAIRTALQAAAAEVSASLVPMAVSDYQLEDRLTTLPLTEGYDDVVPMLGRYSSARDLARRVSRCRVVVTGAYHVAVFALSQGIPVVGLSASRYYDYKFTGLRGMFGQGVHTVALNSDGLPERLTEAVLSSWQTAPAVRESLLAAAERQMAASRQAYARVYELVERAASSQIT
jgi:polysaccharide pyruvyl transferase WcaK-like protein